MSRATGASASVAGSPRSSADPAASGAGASAGTGRAAPPTRSGNWAALVRLLVVVAAVVAAAVAFHLTSLLVVILALVVMIMLHELGHFLTAKWSHMKVTEYFLGFGPRLWSIRRGETEYGVKAIPAGGYVKIVGMSNLEEVDPADEARTYRQQPYHNRLMVAVAGSFMHFVMGFLMLWGLLVFIGVPQPNVVSVVGLVPVAHGVDPAKAAGFRPGDVVLRVDGHPTPTESDVIRAIGSRAGQRVAVLVRRHGVDRTLEVTPQPTAVPVPTDPSRTVVEGRIGVEIAAQGPVQTVDPLRAVGSAAVDLGRVTGESLSAIATTFSVHGLVSFFSELGNAKKAEQAARAGTRPESIYGAVRTATQGARAGPGDLILVLVSIDVFVGIVNLVPMLPLDGGHVLVATYERIRSRRGRPYHADVAKLTPVAYAFILFLVVFVGSAMFLDIVHPVANPFR